MAGEPPGGPPSQHDVRQARAAILDAVQAYVRLMNHDDYVVLACVIAAESMEPATIEHGTYRMTYTYPVESSTPAQCVGLAAGLLEAVKRDMGPPLRTDDDVGA